MKVLVIPSDRSLRFHTILCSALRRSAPGGFGCERLPLLHAQRKGLTWCRNCQNEEKVA